MSLFFGNNRTSTKRKSNYKIRTITLDSKDAFTDGRSFEDCKWTNYLSEPLVLTAPSEIYLESIYIGGYKINGALSGDREHRLAWETTYVRDTFGGYTYYFSIDIPEFEIDTISGLPVESSVADLSHKMHKRFNLCQEPARKSSFVPTALSRFAPLKSEQKPFILGHLSKEAVFVSKISARTISKITVDIKDQDGRTIFNTGAEDLSGNPCNNSRRVFMQFLIIEQKSD